MSKSVVSGASGRSGRIFVDGTELCVTSWDCEEVAEEFDTTSTCSGDTEEAEYGRTMVTGNIEADWKIDLNPFADAPALKAGKKCAALLYINSNKGNVGAPDGPKWDFSEIGIQRIGVANPAKGKVTYKFSFRSTSDYIRPTGEPSSG